MEVRVNVDPINGGGISPVVYLHSAAVFLVCVVAALTTSCECVVEVGEGGTIFPFAVVISVGGFRYRIDGRAFQTVGKSDYRRVWMDLMITSGVNNSEGGKIIGM